MTLFRCPSPMLIHQHENTNPTIQETENAPSPIQFHPSTGYFTEPFQGGDVPGIGKAVWCKHDTDSTDLSTGNDSWWDEMGEEVDDRINLKTMHYRYV